MSSALQRALSQLLDGRDLLPEDAEGAMEEIISGRASDSRIAAFLTALRMKGETVNEIAAFARVMGRFSVRVSPGVEGVLVDTCGTGGDSIKTANISTAAMFVAAGAGVKIAKHGNRAVTGKVGSADILEALGARIDLPREEVERCIRETGVGFMFAPRFHPAMRNIAAVRRELGFRTVFNILGPLTNPAGVDAQLLGVCSAELTEKMALVLRELGRKRAMVVFGLEGIDEISVCGETLVAELGGGVISSYTIRPEDFGIQRASKEDLLCEDLGANIRGFLGSLSGEPGPITDMVILNAGAAIFLGERAGDMREGVELARESVKSGRAYGKLVDFVRATGGDVKKLTEAGEEFGFS